jgi:hypothetical protein
MSARRGLGSCSSSRGGLRPSTRMSMHLPGEWKHFRPRAIGTLRGAFPRSANTLIHLCALPSHESRAATSGQSQIAPITPGTACFCT